MATQHRTPLTPAVTLARRLSSREGLSPPVDAVDVLRRFAAVEWDTIPFNVDGLVLHRPHKPLVILKIGARGKNRERFTAAHELGHIVMPWQAGTISCQPESRLSTDGSEYRDIEFEANQFAGELLAPQMWIKNRLDLEQDLAKQLVSLSDICGVSPMVVAFSAAQVLEDCFIFMTRDNETILSAAGPILGSWGNRSWDIELQHQYEQSGGLTFHTTFGHFGLHVVRFAADHLQRPDRKSGDILSDLAASIAPDWDGQKQIHNKVNGLVSYGHGNFAANSPENYYCLLRSRFAQNSSLALVASHPLFHQYLSARAFELAASRRKSR